MLFNNQRLSASLVAGLVILAGVVILSLCGPLLVDVDKALLGAVKPSQRPSNEFLLGTDSPGRDMLDEPAVLRVENLQVVFETPAGVGGAWMMFPFR